MSLKRLSYSEAKKELEEIISSLESTDVDVDILSAHVKRATQLVSHCKTKLLKTEWEVRNILEDFEKAQNKRLEKKEKDDTSTEEPSLFK